MISSNKVFESIVIISILYNMNFTLQEMVNETIKNPLIVKYLWSYFWVALNT